MAENEYRQTISFQTKGTSDLKAATEAVERLKKESAEFMKAGGLTGQFEKGTRVTDRIVTALNKKGDVVVKLTRSVSDNSKAEERAARQAERTRAKELREKEKAERQAERAQQKERREKEKTFLSTQKQLNQEMKDRTKAKKVEETARAKEEQAAARVEIRQKKIEERQKKMADREATMIRRRGVQGFMQGLSIPGLMSYIPSKAGMGRQMAGYALGRGLRVAGQTVGGGLISGMRGVEAAISGIPAFGPGAAALIGMQRQAGEAAMDFTMQGRGLLQMAPTLLTARNNQIARALPGAAAAGFDPGGEGASTAIQLLQDQLFFRRAERFGLNPQDAQKVMMTALSRGGIEHDDAGNLTAGTQQTALDALTLSARGLNPAMAGVVGKARRLGLGGSQVASAETLRANIRADARAAGLGEADVPELLEKILRQLETANQLGTSPNLRAQTGAALGFAGFGVNAAGAQTMSSALRGAGMSVSQGGGGNMSWLMRAAFGFEEPGLPQNMTPADLLKSDVALERGTYMDPARVGRGLRFIQGAGMGDAAASALILRKMLREGGQNVPAQLIEQMAGGFGESGFATRGRMTALTDQIPGFLANEPSAEALVPDEARRTAALARRQIGVGRGTTDTILKFEEGRMTILETSANTFGGSLNKLAVELDKLASKIAAVSNSMTGTDVALGITTSALAAGGAGRAQQGLHLLGQSLKTTVDFD